VAARREKRPTEKKSRATVAALQQERQAQVIGEKSKPSASQLPIYLHVAVTQQEISFI
jgi:hypothetical protein